MENKVESSKSKYSILSNARFIIQGIKEYDKYLLTFMSINALASALGQFVPVLMPKYVIDELTGNGSPATVIRIVIISGLVMLGSESISGTSQNITNGRFITARLRFIARSGKKFMTTDFQSLENPDVLDMNEKGDRACSGNQVGVEGMMHRILSISSRAVVLAGCLAVISMLHPVMILAISALLTVNFLASSRARRLDKNENDALAPVRRKLIYITNTMSNFAFGKDIRLFGLQDFIQGKYTQEQKSSFVGHVRIQKFWLASKNVNALTSMLQETLLYAWLCWRVIYGGMSIGDFTMFAAAVRTFSRALGGMLDDISHIRQQHEVVCDFRAFLDYPDKPSGSAKPPVNLSETGCAFTFEHVSFRYPNRDEFALKDISIHIKPGERLAVVGLNGAGKTTLIKLLTRLYEPDEGRILLNGTDIRTYDRQEYSRLFSVVFQDIQLFAFTVAENVAMSEYESIDMDRVEACLKKAGLSDKVLTLPKRVDTSVLKVIDEGGIEFSGGENQKLALARALYKDGPVVVLDEPTAALDALAEERLYREFDTLIGNRTAVYISHRLASTRFCDRVVLFSTGHIAEEGTHDALMAMGGQYARMFALQAQYYHEEAQTA